MRSWSSSSSRAIVTNSSPDGKPLPPARAVELMVPVVRALARAHEEGIVHRDLKPDNIFVTESGTIKVLDFGIAKVLAGDDKTSDGEGGAGGEGDPGAELTRHGAIMGTLAYMSPEQWRAQGIDHTTDIWATGIMLYRMLAGQHPLKGLTGMALSVPATCASRCRRCARRPTPPGHRRRRRQVPQKTSRALAGRAVAAARPRAVPAGPLQPRAED